MSCTFPPETRADLRIRQNRDASLLAQIKAAGGFDVLEICANRDKAAAVHRLIQSGALAIGGSGWIAVERPARSIREALADLARRCGL